MPTTKVKGIVLGGVNVKEKDKLVHLYTLEQGKMTVSFKGVRGDRAKLKSAKELFCFGEYELAGNGNINIVTSCEIIDNFYNLSKDIERYYEACAILDIVNKVAVESSPPLFIEIIKALKCLCYEKAAKYYVVDKFFLSYFNLSGYHFLSDRCSSCGARLGKAYFNYDVGELVCPACRTQSCDAVSEPALSAMKILEQTEYDSLSSVKLGGQGEIQAFHILSKNFEWKTGYSVLKLL